MVVSHDFEEGRVGELMAYAQTLPSFVRLQNLPVASEPLQLLHFDLWAPSRSGDAATEYQQGRRHFEEVAHLSAADERAQLLFLVLMTMAGQMHNPNGRTIGPTERGFIDSAADKAIVGALVPDAPDQWAAVAASGDPLQIVRARENEAAMRTALKSSKGGMKQLAALYLVYLMQSDYLPIDLGVWQFASAAMNGGKS